jgi:hypothetical protein
VSERERERERKRERERERERERTSRWSSWGIKVIKNRHTTCGAITVDQATSMNLSIPLTEKKHASLSG